MLKNRSGEDLLMKAASKPAPRMDNGPDFLLYNRLPAYQMRPGEETRDFVRRLMLALD